MSKTEVVRARVEPELKHSAEAVFRELGINTAEAITLFLTQVKLCNGLPFDVRIPNEETLQALEEVRTGKGLKSFATLEEMFADLDSAEKPPVFIKTRGETTHVLLSISEYRRLKGEKGNILEALAELGDDGDYFEFEPPKLGLKPDSH